MTGRSRKSASSRTIFARVSSQVYQVPVEEVGGAHKETPGYAYRAVVAFLIPQLYVALVGGNTH